VRQLEEFQVVLLRRPADAPDLDEATLDRLQDEHLAFLAALRADGRSVTGGPFRDQDDQRMRGLVIYRVASVEEARDIALTDPLVVAGRLEVEALTFLSPPGTLLPPGLPITLDD
jgi:uncharacterized protein YciI